MATLDINEVKRYIRTHFEEVHGIQNIAANVGTTVDVLEHRWRRSGERMPLGKSIEAVRLQKAVTLHRFRPGASCKEIAYRVGYHSVDVGPRCFKRVLGRSTLEVFKAHDSPSE